MNKVLLLLLFFLPLNIIAQELVCCNTAKEVETYLNGDWSKTGKVNDEIVRYHFDDSIKLVEAFTVQEDGTMEFIENSRAKVRVFKTSRGFELQFDWDGLKITHRLTYLDSVKSIVTRRDGKESIKYKIR